MQQKHRTIWLSAGLNRIANSGPGTPRKPPKPVDRRCGENSANSTLTDVKLAEIRGDSEIRGLTRKEIALKHGIKASTVVYALSYSGRIHVEPK